jgi:hypothetical protein
VLGRGDRIGGDGGRPARARADRVLAMLAPVTDRYATLLARSFYHELVVHDYARHGAAR